MLQSCRSSEGKDDAANNYARGHHTHLGMELVDLAAPTTCTRPCGPRARHQLRRHDPRSTPSSPASSASAARIIASLPARSHSLHVRERVQMYCTSSSASSSTSSSAASTAAARAPPHRPGQHVQDSARRNIGSVAACKAVATLLFAFVHMRPVRAWRYRLWFLLCCGVSLLVIATSLLPPYYFSGFTCSSSRMRLCAVCRRACRSDSLHSRPE